MEAQSVRTEAARQSPVSPEEGIEGVILQREMQVHADGAAHGDLLRSRRQGYALKKKNFFRYLYYIVLFGIVGTVIVFGFVSAVAYVATRLPGGLRGGQQVQLAAKD
eukprot:scaffold927_cov230-Pinguiococcus_pyrenoidosus.AAC.3